ncbi:MAG TPA: hypothetical protein VFE78_27790 [Gemmataceae bacterium]|nr:hypothetical protein [Gemmataceae bacterium]
MGRLTSWQQDADLAGLRGRDAIARLPKQEHDEWRQLWADVEATLGKARAKGGPPAVSGKKS